MRYLIKSQLYSDAESQLKGSKQILDDCTWASCAAAITWASKGELNPSAADAVAVMKQVTGRKDVQGKSDNGGSQPEAIKVIAKLGGKARYAKSWNDVVTAAKSGAALLIHVQQPVGYPAGIKISAWHDRWFKWWSKHKPEKIVAGYGHMVSSAWCEDHGFQFACPTRDERTAAEKYAVPVTESQLRQIANSKVKAGKGYKVDYKTVLIVTHPGKKVTTVLSPAPTPVVANPKPAAASPKIVRPEIVQEPPKKLKRNINADVATAIRIVQKIGISKGDQTMREQIVAAALDALQAALSTAIAVFLGLGVSIFDLTGDGAKAVAASAISAGLLVLQRWLDEDNSAYGRTRK